MAITFESTVGKGAAKKFHFLFKYNKTNNKENTCFVIVFNAVLN